MANWARNETIEWTSSAPLGQRLDRWADDASSASRLVVDEPLSRHSSLRIGGRAAYWIEVGTSSDLRSLLAALGGRRCHCVGLGSNVLFPDAGIDDPVIRFVDDLADWSAREETDDGAVVDVGAGAINAHLARGLLSDGWVGAEFLTLIPGTFGGAVALNAGTKEQELQSILESAWLAIPDRPRRCWDIERHEPDELAMSYRYTELPEGAIVLGGRISVRQGDVEAARRRMDDDKERRNETQPYRLASVGSTFANPDGDYAGRLIDEAGLKGTTIGGAKISELHANFFINESDATSDDFLRLMALARYRVRRDFGLELRPEVRLVGFEGDRRLNEFEEQLERNDA